MSTKTRDSHPLHEEFVNYLIERAEVALSAMPRSFDVSKDRLAALGMSALGVSHSRITKVFDIPPETFDGWCRELWKGGSGTYEDVINATMCFVLNGNGCLPLDLRVVFKMMDLMRLPNEE